jgi:hypothetical protein
VTAYTIGAVPGSPPRAYEAPPSPEWSPTVPARPPVPEDALRQQAAALLQHVYRWLEATAPVAPQVLGVVPMLVTAVALYEAREYPVCLNQVQAAIGALQQARWTFPNLPPL